MSGSFTALFFGTAVLAGAAPAVVFDLDLALGAAAIGSPAITVTGGTWDKGWSTTGAKSERIVLDAGVGQKFFASGIASGPGAAEREFAPPTRGDGEDWILILSASEGI